MNEQQTLDKKFRNLKNYFKENTEEEIKRDIKAMNEIKKNNNWGNEYGDHQK